MNDISFRVNSFRSATNEVAKILTDESGTQITSNDVFQALLDVLDLNDSTELLSTNWSADKITDILRGYDMDRLHPTNLETIELEYSIIPNDVPRLVTEEVIKQKGEKWVIHKNDADPFPLNPHAHNYESGHKLHLGSGALYIGRQIVGKLKKKNLKILRDKIRFSPLPELE